jgi:uncharacterized glyoxalase superfamily protein PhnB
MASKKKKTKAKSKKTAKKKTVRKASKSRTKVSPIPEGYGTVTASLILNGASASIDFCKAAFGAKVKSSIAGPNGLIMHAVLKIGSSLVHVGEAMQAFTSRSSLMLYVKNADQVMEAAVAAGAEVVMPLENTFWGDRYGVVKDPQGNQWEIATHIENVSGKELKKRSQAIMIEIAKSGTQGG